MNGAKKDAAGKLRNELTNKVRGSKLSKKEMKQLHSHLTARTKTKPQTREDKAAPQKEKQPITPQARARTDALEIRDRIEYIKDRQGGYKAAWIKHFNYDESQVATIMGDVARRLDVAMATVDEVLRVDQPDDALVQRMSAVSAEFHGVVLPALTQVESLLRTEGAASGSEEAVSDAMRVLNSMQESCDPKEWARAVKSRRGDKIFGKAAVLNAIGTYIGRYVRLWQSIKGDGIADVPHKTLTALNQLRMDIANTIAGSGDVMLMVCCAPGTEFHSNFGKLAAQSCRSRDVEMLESWWAKNTLRTD